VDRFAFFIHSATNANKRVIVFFCLVQALADISSGKKKALVPYRESILTKLLQNALGGNRFVRVNSLSVRYHWKTSS